MPGGGTDPDAPTCTCTTKCSEGNVNSSCPVCRAEGADLSACKGQKPQQGDGGDAEPPKDKGQGDQGYDEGKPGPSVRSATVLDISSVTLEPKTYNGNTDGKVGSVSFDGVPEGESLALGTDYTATVIYNSAGAGIGKTATVTVTLKNNNYSLEENTFTLQNQTIEKATYEGDKTDLGYIVAGSSLYSVQLPSIPHGASYGEPYIDPYYSSYVTDLKIEEDVVLHYAGSELVFDNIYIHITVPVDGGVNYEDYEINVMLKGRDQVELSGEPTLSSDTITYGDKLGDITLSGSMYAGATQVPGTFTWDTPGAIPQAGTYPAQWSFVPEGTSLLYSPASGSVHITVNPRPVELDWGTTVFTYDGTEKSVSAKITNVVGNDNVVPVYGVTLRGTDIKTYAATVIDLDGTDAANYTIVGVANASQE